MNILYETALQYASLCVLAFVIVFITWIILIISKSKNRKNCGKILLGIVGMFILSTIVGVANTPKHEHDWTIGVIEESTCMGTGVQEKVCKSCGEYVVESTPTLGHSWTSSYKDNYVVCTRCKEEVLKTEIATDEMDQSGEPSQNNVGVGVSLLYLLGSIVIGCFSLVLIAFPGIMCVIMIVYCVRGIKKKEQQKREAYEKSSYYQSTHIPYKQIKYDKGAFGEFLIYSYLQHRECEGARFLFNVYVPTNNGETSEIDVLMIDSHGIFVFESKNYVGWIFGSERSQQWCQCLKSRYGIRREYFYNPIKQNQGHIYALSAYLNKKWIPMHNIVTFTNNCVLREIDAKSIVAYTHEVNDVVIDIKNCNVPSLTQVQIEEIYNLLYPLTQITYDEYEKHIKHAASHK